MAVFEDVLLANSFFLAFCDNPFFEVFGIPCSDVIVVKSFRF
jgi:hypothetical protein